MKIILTCVAILALGATSTWAQEVGDNPDSIAGVMKGRQDEAQVMKAFPGLADRQGNVLTLSSNGHPVARFTDQDIGHCEGFETCNAWRFTGKLTLVDETGARQTYLEVFHYIGEGGDYKLVASDGTLVTLNDAPIASANGRYVALGETEGEGEGSLTIIDWASKGHRIGFDFKSPCEPLQWLDATKISVICSRTDGTGTYKFSYVLGTVQQVAPDTWQLQETYIVDDYPTRKPARDPGFKPQSETGRLTVAAEPSDKGKADSANYDRDAGYEKLN